MIQHSPSATAPARIAAATFRSSTMAFQTSNGRDFGERGEGHHEEPDAQAGEDQGIEHGNVGHSISTLLE